MSIGHVQQDTLVLLSSLNDHASKLVHSALERFTNMTKYKPFIEELKKNKYQKLNISV